MNSFKKHNFAKDFKMSLECSRGIWSGDNFAGFIFIQSCGRAAMEMFCQNLLGAFYYHVNTFAIGLSIKFLR